MRTSLRLLLPQLAFVATGCSSLFSDSSASNCTSVTRPDQTFTPSQACALVRKHADEQDAKDAATPHYSNGTSAYYDVVSRSVCDEICPSDNTCDFSATFVQEALTAGDAGTPAACAGSEVMTVRCANFCPIEGRHTEGVERFFRAQGLPLGEYFASCAYAEAVSVLAFERIAEELRSFGGPEQLILEAKRAAAEEVDHTRTMEALAFAWGAETRRPSPTAFAPRALFEFAMENAIEGCAKETFGATIGILQAERATSSDVRNAMRSIAKDECGHADLSWRIAAWVRSQLSAEENIALETATRDALRDMRNGSHLQPSDADRLIGYVSPDERRALVEQLEAHLPWSVAA